MKILVLFSFLVLSLNCYVIDFENADGHLKLESNALHNGQIIQEPNVEHVLSKLY